MQRLLLTLCALCALCGSILSAPLPVAQLDEASKMLDHAAAQDMRWWFLGLLSVGGLAIWILGKYFTRLLATVSARVDQLQDARTRDFKESQDKLLTILSENSAAFRAFSEVLGSLKHLIVPAKS